MSLFSPLGKLADRAIYLYSLMCNEYDRGIQQLIIICNVSILLSNDSPVKEYVICNCVYRTGGVSRRRASRSITRDNAQLPMLSEPCSCWPVADSMGSGH